MDELKLWAEEKEMLFKIQKALVSYFLEDEEKTSSVIDGCIVRTLNLFKLSGFERLDIKDDKVFIHCHDPSLFIGSLNKTGNYPRWQYIQDKIKNETGKLIACVKAPGLFFDLVERLRGYIWNTEQNKETFEKIPDDWYKDLF